jgi:hypothetical protein
LPPSPQAVVIPARKKQRLEEPLPTTTDEAARKTASPDVSTGLPPAAADYNDDANANIDPVLARTGPWEDEELTNLKNAVQALGTKNWNEIATFVSGRSGGQCRCRWNKLKGGAAIKAILDGQLPRFLNFFKHIPLWAECAIDLLSRFQSKLHDLEERVPLFHISLASPNGLYRLENQEDARDDQPNADPHLHGGWQVNTKHGVHFTTKVYAGHSVFVVLDFGEFNNGRGWISLGKTIYIYVIAANNPEYDSFEPCAVRGGLEQLRWYTKSSRTVKPDRCFRGECINGVYQFTEVLLGNINCDAPPLNFAAGRPARL